MRPTRLCAFALASVVALGCGDDDGSSDPDGSLPDGSVSPDGALPMTDGGGPDGFVPPVTCGNGALDEGEVCDGELLGGATCASELGTAGTLACADHCLGFDTSACECAPRTTCDELDCAAVDDGCGGTLDCGGCPGELSCGGAGTPNRCGRSCADVTCPSGASCGEDGICLVNGVLDIELAFHEVTFAVSTSGVECSDARLSIGRPGFLGDRELLTPSCSGSAGTASIWLPDGAYDISPTAAGVDFLDLPFEVAGGPVTVDVPLIQHSLSGRIRQDGGTPDRDPICSAGRDPTSTLTFVRSDGREFTVRVDCRNGFRFGPAALEPGVYDVWLEADAVEFAIVGIGTWAVDLGSVDVTGDVSDLDLEFETYHIGGPFTVNGRVPVGCDDADVSVTLESPFYNRSRYPFVCDDAGRAVLDMDLPVGQRLSTFSLGRFQTLWNGELDPLDMDTTAFDLPVPNAVISGPIVRNGVPVECTGWRAGVFTGADGGNLTRLVCEDGTLVLLPLTVPVGHVSATIQNTGDLELEITGDRLDMPLELEPRGTVSIQVRGLPAAVCSSAVIHTATGGFAGGIDCDATPPTFRHDDARVGDWPVSIDVSDDDRRSLGTLTVRANEEATMDVTLTHVAAGEVVVAFTYDGVAPPGLTGIPELRAGGLTVYDAPTGMVPLPAHVTRAARDFRWSVETGDVVARWVRADVPMAESGVVTVDVEPIYVSGRLTLRGVDVVDGCTSLGRIQMGGASGPLGCDGSFGPLPLAAGTSSVGSRVSTGIQQRTLPFVLGPHLRFSE